MNSDSASDAWQRESPRGVARALLFLIEAYRLILSPILGGHCRFVPSCSAFADEAVRRHGAARGARLAIGRLLRCHPFRAGGPDPVP